MNEIQITDMAGARPEHSAVIVNFVSAILKQVNYPDFCKSGLFTTVTEKNKDELKIVHFPRINITFEDLFEEIEL